MDPLKQVGEQQFPGAGYYDRFLRGQAASGYGWIPGAGPFLHSLALLVNQCPILEGGRLQLRLGFLFCLVEFFMAVGATILGVNGNNGYIACMVVYFIAAAFIGIDEIAVFCGAVQFNVVHLLQKNIFHVADEVKEENGELLAEDKKTYL